MWSQAEHRHVRRSEDRAKQGDRCRSQERRSECDSRCTTFLGPKWITVHALRIHSQMNDGTLPEPRTFKRTDRPSPVEIASVATSRCSSRFGPPYGGGVVPPLAKGEVVWLPSHAGSTGSVKVMLNPSARLHRLNFEGGVPIWFSRCKPNRVPFQLQLPLEPVPPAYKQPSGPQRRRFTPHSNPWVNRKTALGLLLHLFKLHAADPAHGQFAQEELPGKRAIMNFQRRGRRI